MLTPEVDARVDEVLRVIVDGIDAGVFPCRVDPPTTWTRRIRSYADPDARGTRDRYREWQRKRRRTGVRGYVALAEPDVLAEDDDTKVPAMTVEPSAATPSRRGRDAEVRR